jgi:hypothetical protein
MNPVQWKIHHTNKQTTPQDDGMRCNEMLMRKKIMTIYRSSSEDEEVLHA